MINFKKLPKTKPARIALGILLILGGLLGFLPILGFWMIPLGLLVLSVDFAWIRRKRRKLEIWWASRNRSKNSTRQSNR